MLVNQYDQVGIGYDQCIWIYGDYWFQVVQEGFQFGVVWGDVDYYVEVFVKCVGFGDVFGQLGVVEIVVVYLQVVVWLFGVDGIGVVGEGIVYVFQGVGGVQQFGVEGGGGYGLGL